MFFVLLKISEALMDKTTGINFIKYFKWEKMLRKKKTLLTPFVYCYKMSEIVLIKIKA